MVNRNRLYRSSLSCEFGYNTGNITDPDLPWTLKPADDLHEGPINYLICCYKAVAVLHAQCTALSTGRQAFCRLNTRPQSKSDYDVCVWYVTDL